MKTTGAEAIKQIVYIVDDDVLVRRAIQRLIRSAGLEAETFATAEEFLDSGFRDQHACLIADVRMPNLTGLDLQQKMITRGYNLPVIFITGFDAEDIREKVKRAGAVGYFSKQIDDQALLDTKPFNSPESGETLTNDLTHEEKSVANYGFGADYFSSESLIFSGSFVTYFSVRVPETQTNLTFSTWNIYHISGGTTFKIGNSDLTLGLEYAFGSKEIDQPIDITDPGNDENADIVNKSDVTINRIKLLIGFVF